jgi:hypothetical protein
MRLTAQALPPPIGGNTASWRGAASKMALQCNNSKKDYYFPL